MDFYGVLFVALFLIVTIAIVVAIVFVALNLVRRLEEILKKIPVLGRLVTEDSCYWFFWLASQFSTREGCGCFSLVLMLGLGGGGVYVLDGKKERDTSALIEKAKKELDEDGDGKADFSVFDVTKPEKVLPPVLVMVADELASYGLDAEKMSVAIRKNPSAFREPLPEKIGLFNRKRFIALTPEDEVRIGNIGAQEIAATRELYHDATAEARVRGIAEKIAAQLPKPVPVQIFLVRDDTANAFCLPNGNVYVHSGLLERTESDDMLAGILGHEYAHLAARHSAEAFTKFLFFLSGNVIVEDKMKALCETIISQHGWILRRIYLTDGKAGVLLPISRHMEKEADILGLRYMARAGFNPIRVTELYESVLSDAGTTSAWSTFSSTHPTSKKRERWIRKEAERLTKNNDSPKEEKP